MAQIWCLCTNFICKRNLEIHSDFMCDCRKMKHAVGRTSQCHVNSQSINDGIFCHDISRTDVFLQKFHNFHTSLFCQTNSLRINSRNRSVAAKSHTKYLCQTVHAVRCIHTGAGTTGRAYLTLKLIQSFIRNLACCVSTDCLKHARKTSLLSAYMAGKHRAAADKYSRHIDSCCCHQKSRYIFVTVWHHNKSIKLMCHCHCLCRICDQISCYEGIFHSDMSHGNSVTNCDCREYTRYTSCHGNTHFYCLYDFIQVHMSRNNFIVGAYDTDKRFVHLFFC